MKKTLLILVVIATLVACKTNDKKTTGVPGVKDAKEEGKTKAITDTAEFTTVQWIDSTFKDLGKQKHGKEIEISYRFKNTGTKNLVIENVSAECGCTIPEKPEKPFAPGEEGLIKAKYNGSGSGETRKRIYVKANIKPTGEETLTFRADMIE